MRILVMMLWALTVGCASETPDTEPSDEQMPADELVSAPGDSYLACGCGCCGGVAPTVRCLAPGETLQSIIARDKEQAASPNCPFQGCFFPVKYVDCGTTPPAP
ncbi:hypothetical protein POL68_28430 [Stigmatella sp. ncwal1]|uniref:Uncharacterized protein n=1 Tax=Stigmatella ashevillensis TaxID=2995309 RepID=A0ABT5DFH7_9BACT|nr:hypothetical protein [Stigmatella ashevillena]MDC0712422.1 hypothetical protein [Stigmatella ashevillena]